MIISQVKLRGYRNFKNSTINLRDKTLIIGANDIGKSNLLYALRILLDRSLSDIDIEPQDSDFFVHDNTNELSITIKFEKVVEECVIAKLKGYVSDKNELFLRYSAYRDPASRAKTYKFWAGFDENKMEEIAERFYRKVLNLKYISSNRDLLSYIRREKKYLFQEAKEKRTSKEVKEDDMTINDVESGLGEINSKISNLSFIKSSTVCINKELKDLSFHHESQDVSFDVGTSDVSRFIDNVQLACRSNGKSIAIGGDGRNNQIFLALWAAKNEIQDDQLLEVSFYCIEEPESHLHPHQQRKLAEYLSNILKGQVLITTHSPQIASEFSPNSIVRLYKDNLESKAANDGCSEIVEQALIEFGHRLNTLPAEAFFSDVVLLVEGASEVLFYKALAEAISIDLDRMNISVLMVDGIDFPSYVKVLTELRIPWVLRTDNDIFRIPKKTPIQYRFAGVERIVKIYESYLKSIKNITELDRLIKEKSKMLSGFLSATPPAENETVAKQFIKVFEQLNIYVSDKDLENDLVKSGISAELKTYYSESDDRQVIEIMQEKKATSMHDFLFHKAKVLSKLKNDKIAQPLTKCVELLSI